jgi:hypothetical protein
MHRPPAANTREEYALSSEEGPAGGQKKEQGYLEKVLDKLQKKRRGEKSPGSAVDKAIEKAQELALRTSLPRYSANWVRREGLKTSPTK